MPYRDLTRNVPGIEVSEWDSTSESRDQNNHHIQPNNHDIENYTNQSDHELSHYASQTDDRLEQEHSQHEEQRESFSSSSSQSHLNSFTPPYNAYPKDSATNSFTNLVSSTTNLVSSTSNLNRSSVSSSLGRDVNPFVDSIDSPMLLAEFNAFGGYPASAFPLYIEDKEDDDYLHNPDPISDTEYDKNRFFYDLKSMDRRSLGGLLAFVVLLIGALCLFVLFPILTYSGLIDSYKPETYEVLTHYKYPLLSAIRTDLVDPDTPSEALFRESQKGEKWPLVFSDEFNAEGRTFYEGDDQFFTAPDLHYDATKDLEWYDPDAVTTANGTINLRMDAYKNHDLFYRSGMVQSWNKMCFTQGIIEISARLPNYGNISGLWPGLWTMGNLGRPGYLATTEGVWPYTYESCDAGITANQSSPDGISYLPGQRLNACTCPGESHPNRGTGRGAPEIDALEGEIHLANGRASQSFQVAPYDIWYYPDYDFIEIYNKSVTVMNTYTGGPFQQAVSAVTSLNTTWYEKGANAGRFQTYGFELINDNDDGYNTWFVGKDPTFTVQANALHPNGNIGWRRLAKEPMSIIMNMGISNNWAYIDWPSLHFPVTMRIDYVRVYQPPNAINLGCDPEDYPTADYIESHLNIYQNVNLTSFKDGGYSFPKNKLLNNC